jgi:DNA-binding XRE family transcriptional regulator
MPLYADKCTPLPDALQVHTSFLLQINNYIAIVCVNRREETAMQLPATFGGRLHMARWQAGLEQRQLGSRVGLTGHTIGRLERGQTTQISIDALRRIARELGVTTDWLLAMDVPEEDAADAEEEELIAIPSQAVAVES